MLDSQESIMDVDVYDFLAPLEAESRHSCSTCPVGHYCLPRGLLPSEARRLDHLMRIGRTLRTHQYLYRAGDPLTAIYAVRRGAFKTVIVDCEGHEQVVGFQVHTELLGLDGIFTGVHHCSGIALSQAKVCIFPYESLLELSTDIHALATQLLRLMSKEIASNIVSAGDYIAEERLAAFLLSLARRVQPRGELSLHFTLPMSRADLASYLRIAGETLSRTLARLQQQNIICLDKRNLHITDFSGLRRLGRRVPPPLL